ncbi:MAG: class I SAM-dependent methyltransferase, partial [Chlamydiae bacterium]|nr:class I SAM-dependent methyltransferase [Chlamydiota bacterium]
MRKYNLLAILLTFLAAYSIVEGAGIEDAKAYSKNSSIQWVWATEAINHYSWNGNEYVLDVGCGDGKITALIAKDKVPNGSVIGLDISQNMIQEASTNFQLHDYPNLSFVKEDIVASRLENKFDLVTSFCCLNWVLEQETALQNIHKSLVSGGKFLLVVAEKNSNDFLSLNEKLSKSEKWKLHLPEFKNPNIYFTKDKYISLLKDAGFSEIESKV